VAFLLQVRSERMVLLFIGVDFCASFLRVLEGCPWLVSDETRKSVCQELYDFV
jgi:hypothetical protein